MSETFTKNDTDKPCIITRSGQLFCYESPESFEYSLADIGFALGNICRYAGQGGWYSVAQHSLVVSFAAEPRDKLRALLHDASEAYMVDVPGPLKKMSFMSGYRELEARVMRAIHKQFGVLEDVESEERVKIIDVGVRRPEARMLGLTKVPLIAGEYDIPGWVRALNNGSAGIAFEREAKRLINAR